MTREEVITLSKEELRIKTAELLGFEASMQPMSLREWIEQGNFVAHLNGKREIIPDWPNDITAALELTESAESIEIHKFPIADESTGERWWAALSFLKPASFGCAFGSSPSHAINRAFILAMTPKSARL